MIWKNILGFASGLVLSSQLVFPPRPSTNVSENTSCVLAQFWLAQVRRPRWIFQAMRRVNAGASAFSGIIMAGMRKIIELMTHISAPAAL